VRGATNELRARAVPHALAPSASGGARLPSLGPGRPAPLLQIDQLFNNSEKRLARTLLILARYGKPDGPTHVLPKLSQEVLAEMVGTTRSRVNIFMNKFGRLGFIEYNGDIVVHQALLSVVLHDSPPVEP
jgi:hypothetical protein